jgi:hypothetical protein
MTHEIPRLECSGTGFFGGNGPTVERKCETCNGTGVLVEDGVERLQRKPTESHSEAHKRIYQPSDPANVSIPSRPAGHTPIAPKSTTNGKSPVAGGIQVFKEGVY